MNNDSRVYKLLALRKLIKENRVCSICLRGRKSTGRDIKFIRRGSRC